MSEREISRFSSRLDGFLSARPSLTRCVSGLGLLFENLIKIPLFRCQRCGDCVLSHTAFICSQRCPKRLRNGACGGTWYAIYARSRVFGRVPMLTEMLAPHRWDLEHTSTWLNVFRGREEVPTWRVARIVRRLDLDVAKRARQEREP